jgi:hypothetical protein
MHSHHRHGHGHGHGHGRIHFRGPFPNRLDLLERLENYRRDLEQELADVADLVRRLKDEAPPEGPPQTASV